MIISEPQGKLWGCKNTRSKRPWQCAFYCSFIKFQGCERSQNACAIKFNNVQQVSHYFRSRVYFAVHLWIRKRLLTERQAKYCRQRRVKPLQVLCQWTLEQADCLPLVTSCETKARTRQTGVDRRGTTCAFHRPQNNKFLRCRKQRTSAQRQCPSTNLFPAKCLHSNNCLFWSGTTGQRFKGHFWVKGWEVLRVRPLSPSGQRLQDQRSNRGYGIMGEVMC